MGIEKEGAAPGRELNDEKLKEVSGGAFTTEFTEYVTLECTHPLADKAHMRIGAPEDVAAREFCQYFKLSGKRGNDRYCMNCEYVRMLRKEQKNAFV